MNNYSVQNKYACILMASGESKRFGSNKLLAEFGGRKLIERALNATDSPLINTRLVLTRTPEVKAICDAQGVWCILHDLPNRSDAMRLGIEELGNCRWDAVIFCPCDQPLLSRKSVEELILAFDRGSKGIYRLVSDSDPKRVGAPTMFAAKYAGELAALQPGEGGRKIMRRVPEDVGLVPVPERELEDVDTPEDMEILAASV